MVFKNRLLVRKSKNQNDILTMKKIPGYLFLQTPRVKVNESRHTELFPFSESIKKLFSTNCVNNFFPKIFFNRFLPVKKAFLNWLCQYLSFLNIFFQYILPVEMLWVTPHCLYRDSLTLNIAVINLAVVQSDFLL